MKCDQFKSRHNDKKGLLFNLNEEKVQTISFDLLNTKCKENMKLLCLMNQINNIKEERVGLSKLQRQ